jgi:hypothetical protein
MFGLRIVAVCLVIFGGGGRSNGRTGGRTNAERLIEELSDDNDETLTLELNRIIFRTKY